MNEEKEVKEKIKEEMKILWKIYLKHKRIYYEGVIAGMQIASRIGGITDEEIMEIEEKAKEEYKNEKEREKYAGC